MGRSVVARHALAIGQELTGKVTKIVTKKGATLELEGHHLPGFLHISNLKKERVGDVREVLTEGDEIKVKVLKWNPVEIAVSLRDNPKFYKTPPMDFEVGAEVEGKLVTISRKSLFLDVGAQVDAVVRSEGLPDLGEDVQLTDAFQKGQDVRARVSEVGPQMLRLTMLD